MYPVAVLFARSRSAYFDLAADVYDATRDARTYSGALPVVAHPPCRAWGRLSHMAKPRHDERDLALFAVEAVRRCGGVLEHPGASRLWSAADLPAPGARDAFGGWTLPVLQSWWGHRAPKRTLLYVCGVRPGDVPPIPFELGEPDGRVQLMGRAERERTPLPLMTWLLELASLCRGADVR